MLAAIPYRQVAEKGFECIDDGEPIRAITVTAHTTIEKSRLLELLPNEPITLSAEAFDLDDDAYAHVVRRVIESEIGSGDGANFVVQRSFTAVIEDYDVRCALGIFRRLLAAESGAYWTFLVHLGDRTLIGASPERHVSLDAGIVTMNPISGTYRYPSSGPSISDALRFLSDQKETDELLMVVDEELKMMARMCQRGGRIRGPFLKAMARLAHTEYLLEGESTLDITDVLRETLVAPTVVGSPVENACRVVARHERCGRGYYSGVLALIGQDTSGRSTLDSAILIRTADIHRTGMLRIGVGATVVRHSDPATEAAETQAKAAGVLAAIRSAAAPSSQSAGQVGLGNRPEVLRSLARRNSSLAPFWFRAREHGVQDLRPLSGRQLLVIDAEDTFTSMLGIQLTDLGAEVTIRRFDEPLDQSMFELVLLGPGPGDPRNRGHSKIEALRRTGLQALTTGQPLLAVCLGHQVLCDILGLAISRRTTPNQGRQYEIDLFDRRRRVGFYNSFSAVSEVDQFTSHLAGGTVAVSRDRVTGEVHGLRGPRLNSMQFHPESVLSPDGVDILTESLLELLPPQAVRLPA